MFEFETCNIETSLAYPHSDSGLYYGDISLTKELKNLARQA